MQKSNSEKAVMASLLKNSSSSALMENELTTLSDLLQVSPSIERVYRELEEMPVQSYDLIDELNSNLRQLEELQGKFSFMMRDIRSQMKL